MSDPTIGATYYPDDVYESRKRYQPRRRPSGRSDLSLSRRQSRESFQSVPETKQQPRRRSYSPRRRNRSRSRSYSPRRRNYSRSPSPRRASPSPRRDPDPEKPWFKKKTLWATVASIASVASVVAVSLSTRATTQSAKATTESAKATRKSARATMHAATAAHRSADASTRIADGNDLSTKAVVNTAVANGHMDHQGRYLGPSQPAGGDAVPMAQLPWDRPANGHGHRRSSNSRSRGSRHSHNHKPFGPGLLEYEPAARV